MKYRENFNPLVEFFILSGTIGELDGLARENKKLKTEVNIVKQTAVDFQ